MLVEKLEIGETNWLKVIAEDLSRIKGDAASSRNHLTASIAGFSAVLTSLFALFAIKGLGADVLIPIGFYFISVSYLYMGIVALAAIYHRDLFSFHSRSRKVTTEFDPTQVIQAIHYSVVAGASLILANESFNDGRWYAPVLAFIGVTFILSAGYVLFTHRVLNTLQDHPQLLAKNNVDRKTDQEKKDKWTRDHLIMSVFGFGAGAATFYYVWESVGLIEYLGTAILLVSALSSALISFRHYHSLTRISLVERELVWLRQNVLLDGIEEGEIRRRYQDLCLVMNGRTRIADGSPSIDIGVGESVNKPVHSDGSIGPGGTPGEKSS